MTNGADHEGREMSSGESSFALLSVGGTRLLIPQGEVRVLDLAVDVERSGPPPGGVGWISFRQEYHPVYCPSDELGCLAEVPEGRPICAVLEAGGPIIGLLCTEVVLLRLSDAVLYEVPAAMLVPESPYRRLAMVGEELACVSSAEQLHRHLLRSESDDGKTFREAQ